MQRNRSCQREIWNGSSSVPVIESTQMDQEQTEPPELGTGKPLEKIGRFSVTLLLPLSLVTEKPWFSIVEELL